MSEFYNVLRKLREARGLMQKDVANALGISPAAYSLYEKGQREPKFDFLQKIADFFGVSIDYLMTGKEVIDDRFSEESTILSAKVAKSSDLKELVKNYEKLNGTGKSKAAEQVEMLTKIPEYQKDN